MSISVHSPNICTFCGGNGKCSPCDGTGVNPHVNEPEPKCQRCSGSGVCAHCLGTGSAYLRPPVIKDLGLDKL